LIKLAIARNKTKANPTNKKSSQEQKQEKIRKKAYEMFEKRGYANGSDWADWLEAERIVKSGK
jgi:hypothetical protein